LQAEKTELLRNFAARLKAARVRRKATLAQVGLACGVQPSTVGQWEQAANWPKVEIHLKLAEYLGTSVMHLIYGRTGDIGPTARTTENLLIEPTVRGAAPGSELARKLCEDFAAMVETAGDDRDRLGWLRVQLDQTGHVVRSWRTFEEVNEEARRLAKKMGEEAARQREEFERTLADPSRLGAEMERLRQRALLEDDARRSRKTG